MVAVIYIVVFFAVILGIGFYSRKMVSSSSDFLLAGRQLGTGINATGVMASGFAGTVISLAPAYFIMYGFKGTFVFAVAFSIVGFIIYGLLFSRVIRRSGATTLMEWLEMRYDGRVRKVLTITGFIGMVAMCANNCLAMANVLSGYFGWSNYFTVALSVIVFLLFTYFSGMWGISMTDVLQALIGCVGVPILIIACVNTFGGFDVAATTWTNAYNTNLMSAGISGMVLKDLSPVYPSTLTLILNLGIFLVWCGNHYWIRCASCRTEKVAKNSTMIGGVILFVIAMAIGLIGFYGGAFMGDQFTLLGGDIAPGSGYGAVIAHFPQAIGAFLLVFALAAALSTCSGTLLGAVSIATKDIYPLFINKNATDVQIRKAAKIATVLVSAIAWLLAYYPGGITFLTAFATAWMAPAGLLFIVGMLWKRVTPKAALISGIITLVLESVWVVLDLTKIPINGQPIGTYFHMGIVGVLSAVIPVIIATLVTKPKYYGTQEWAEKWKKEKDNYKIASYSKGKA